MIKKRSKAEAPLCVSPDSPELVVHPALTVHFSYCLYKCAMRLRAMMDRKLAKIGLVAPHMGILRFVDLEKQTSQVEIARSLGVDTATMVKLIDSLQKAKLVARTPCPEDRRVNQVTLTAKGKKVLERASEIRREVEAEFLVPATTEEKELLLRIMPKLLANAL